MIPIRCDTVQVHLCTKNENGEYLHLLLLRASNTQPYPDMWQVVTGSVREGEKAFEAATREVFEETGVAVHELVTLAYVGSFYSAKTDTLQLIPTFAAVVPGSSPITLSKEHRAYRWCDRNAALLALSIPSHRHGVQIFHEMIESEIVGELTIHVQLP